MKKVLIMMLTLTVLGFGNNPVFAEDARDKSSAAVSAILFENEVDEIVTFSVDDAGRVDLTFPRNTPDKIYSVILNKLKSHPDIKSVLAGKGGPACAAF